MLVRNIWIFSVAGLLGLAMSVVGLVQANDAFTAVGVFCLVLVAVTAPFAFSQPRRERATDGAVLQAAVAKAGEKGAEVVAPELAGAAAAAEGEVQEAAALALVGAQRVRADVPQIREPAEEVLQLGDLAHGLLLPARHRGPTIGARRGSWRELPLVGMMPAWTAPLERPVSL